MDISQVRLIKTVQISNSKIKCLFRRVQRKGEKRIAEFGRPSGGSCARNNPAGKQKPASDLRVREQAWLDFSEELVRF
jgi:hypothetical protein